MSDRPRSILVPARRPPLLRDLIGLLQGLNLRWDGLHAASGPLLFDDLADGLDALFRIAADLAPRRGGTGCAEHPGGPADPEPPAGWGTCLLCNLRRRRTRLDHIPAAAPAAPRWTMPPPPYTFAALQDLMAALRDAVFELDLISHPHEFTAAADLVHQAFIVARELSRPRAVSGCARHPGAPAEPPEDGGGCVLCRVRERRGDDPGVALWRPPSRRRVLKRKYAYVDDTGPADT